MFWCDVPRPEEAGMPFHLLMRDRNPYIDDVAMTFEEICVRYENAFRPYICACCASTKPCDRCLVAVGFHDCDMENMDDVDVASRRYVWKAGSLHAGQLDLKVALWGLMQRNVPLDAIRITLQKWIAEEHLHASEENTFFRQAQDMRDCQRTRNPLCNQDFTPNVPATSHYAPLSDEELADELLRREALLRERTTMTACQTQCTDQWRVYEEVTATLSQNQLLRMLVRAPAGTGKSFLLETVALWCLVKKIPFEAGAPTSIAAARINVARTKIQACTAHHLFKLDLLCSSKLDINTPDDPGMQRLITMRLLLFDE